MSDDVFVCFFVHVRIRYTQNNIIDVQKTVRYNDCRNGNSGIGKPEPLTGNLSGFWSRRINDRDRLMYKLDECNVYILACRYHYNKE